MEGASKEITKMFDTYNENTKVATHNPDEGGAGILMIILTGSCWRLFLGRNGHFVLLDCFLCFLKIHGKFPV